VTWICGRAREQGADNARWSEPASGRTGKQAECPACRRLAVQARDFHSTGPDGTQPSSQRGGRISGQAFSLSPWQACRHANRHPGRKAGGHNSMSPRPSPRRRAAALRMRESLRNMKASALCYNFRHIPFDVSATLCLNGAPDAGRISDAFTTASLDLGLPAVHRLPQRHERAPGVGARVSSTVCGGVIS